MNHLTSQSNCGATGSFTGISSLGQDLLVSKVRKICPQPYRVLDAPSLVDDFYLNLVDWSLQNVLAVALGHNVVLWNGNTLTATKLMELNEENRGTSVSWSQQGSHLSVGTMDGKLEIWDVEKQKQVRVFTGHRSRVSSCVWSGSLIASGSKDKKILVRDFRSPCQYEYMLEKHTQEVCGLRWSPHDDKMLASGGNDNKLMLWNVGHSRPTEPLAKFGQHKAAVKAINWSPLKRGLLVTGGGTAD